ncbi:hypothetical protein XENOCAPTIV_004325 [Xenoophorus captivus]|uniref:Dual specificity protein phosphatase n=1 Tax=Xenoophorus captivus TaxID=1517983 RepID=A0ABV0QGD8_9TELE
MRTKCGPGSTLETSEFSVELLVVCITVGYCSQRVEIIVHTPNYVIVYSGAEYYAGMNITYHGIEAHDSPTFDMSVNFYPAAEFIHKALTSGGRVLVHCTVGVSRSATLVLAYLMIRQNLTLVEAIRTVKDHRGVIPNRGHSLQLRSKSFHQRKLETHQIDYRRDSVRYNSLTLSFKAFTHSLNRSHFY